MATCLPGFSTATAFPSPGPAAPNPDTDGPWMSFGRAAIGMSVLGIGLRAIPSGRPTPVRGACVRGVGSRARQTALVRVDLETGIEEVLFEDPIGDVEGAGLTPTGYELLSAWAAPDYVKIHWFDSELGADLGLTNESLREASGYSRSSTDNSGADCPSELFGCTSAPLPRSSPPRARYGCRASRHKRVSQLSSPESRPECASSSASRSRSHRHRVGEHRAEIRDRFGRLFLPCILDSAHAAIEPRFLNIADIRDLDARDLEPPFDVSPPPPRPMTPTRSLLLAAS